jgi:TRAP-type C4-dicarboxylate transport system substrate-binding protein
MRIISGIVAATLFMLLLGTGSAHALVIKIATLSPDGSAWMEKMRAGGEEVAQKTDGAVKFKFYPGGVMGDDKAVLRKIRLGQLQGGAVVSGSLAEAYPDTQVYCLPLVFESFDQAAYVRERMDPVIAGGIEESGYVVLGMAGGGFAHIMSRTPVTSVEELGLRKLWAPENDEFSLEVILAYGANPIPLSIADVLAGLQTSLIDTIASSPVAAIALQWHTQVKYVTDIPLMYVYGILMLDKRTFEKLTPEQQTIVRDVMGRVFREIEQRNLADNDKALAAIEKQGVEFLSVPEAELMEWRQAADAAATRMVEKNRLSQGVVDKLEQILEDYRKENLPNE